MSDQAATDSCLTPAEKGFLRELAHVAVTAAAEGKLPPEPRQLAEKAGIEIEPRLQAKRGVFITLTLDGHLRGCIGHIEGQLPLIDAVLRNGRAAACEDPRFPPVTADEVPRLEWEVSVLTPLHAVAGSADIVLGRHGILLSKRGRQAVFLPQVATEQGWSLETTLSHLALKAGLAADEWSHGAEFKVFEAEVF